MIPGRSGDALLRAAGKRLAIVVGKTGTVARLGGDEFAALMPGTDADALRIVMEQALFALHRPLVFAGIRLRCGASAGGALAPSDGCEAGRIYKHADLALGIAKSGGKGRYIAFNSTMMHRLDEWGRNRRSRPSAADLADGQAE